MCDPLDIIAMHGWASDARCWEGWRSATEPRGWRWHTGERGYGESAPRMPSWPERCAETRRLFIGHSLGPHLVPAEILQEANAVVLLASFATFAPPGREGRRARAALAGMAASLDAEEPARTMLKNFMRKVAEPQPPELLPPGPVDGPLEELNRARLREDLALLARCQGLPEGFPRGARVLIVEAEGDRIVEPAARELLRQALPGADVIKLGGTGHALLTERERTSEPLVPTLNGDIENTAGLDLIGRVVEWVEGGRGSQR